MAYYVYVLTNWNNKVMYVGVTNDLIRRIFEHRNKLVQGFTEKYNVHKLVHFEETEDVVAAIDREKEIKKWRREKKPACEQDEPNLERLESGVVDDLRFLPSVEMT